MGQENAPARSVNVGQVCASAPVNQDFDFAQLLSRPDSAPARSVAVVTRTRTRWCATYATSAGCCPAFHAPYAPTKPPMVSKCVNICVRGTRAGWSSWVPVCSLRREKRASWRRSIVDVVCDGLRLLRWKMMFLVLRPSSRRLAGGVQCSLRRVSSTFNDY